MRVKELHSSGWWRYSFGFKSLVLSHNPADLFHAVQIITTFVNVDLLVHITIDNDKKTLPCIPNLPFETSSSRSSFLEYSSLNCLRASDLNWKWALSLSSSLFRLGAHSEISLVGMQRLQEAPSHLKVFNDFAKAYCCSFISSLLSIDHWIDSQCLSKSSKQTIRQNRFSYLG
jgi:hypothetical protein